MVTTWLPQQARREELKAVWQQAQGCTKCPQLASTRHTVVFGAGNADADLMFVGEAPGANEDKQGLPFVGQAGRLLETLLGEIGHGARGRLHLQRPEVPPAREPRSAAGRDRRLPGLPVPPARADRAARRVHARQLRDEAAARRPGHRDHAAARPRGAAPDRAAQRAPVPALPPGRGALHAVDARDPADRLRPHPGRSSRCPVPEQPEPEPEPESSRRSCPSRRCAAEAAASRHPSRTPPSSACSRAGAAGSARARRP